MGVKLLLLSVIFQTVITKTLGGILPFSDSIGKVTPIKPKPLPASILSSSVTTPSPICDNKDIIPKGSMIREFSSPLAFTSSSRALPVPKIDSSSIENVKIPERLTEKFLGPCKAPINNVKPGSPLPEMSLPYKYPFLSSPTKRPNPSSDVCTAPVNSSKSLKRNGLTPSYPEKFSSNKFPFRTPFSSPYPLHYKSTYLPVVKTPASLSFQPFPFNRACNNNFSSQFGSHNLLSPKTSIFDTSLNSLPGRNDASLSLSVHPIKIAEILRPINPIQLPISPSNEPISSKTVSSAQDVLVNNPWPPKEVYTGSTLVPFVSKLEPPKSALSTISLRCDEDPLSSLPYSWAGRTSDIKLKPCTPPVIKPSAYTSPKICLNSPKTPLVPIVPSSPILDVLSNRISSFDCSKNIDTTKVFPIIGFCSETIEKINPNNFPGLEGINPSSLSSYQYPSFTKECVSIPFQYSPPKIPTEPIPITSSGTSSFSANSYSPSRISQTPTTPVPYINQYPISSIVQTTSNMVSSFTTLLSNVVENILSSNKSSINSAPPNILQTCSTQLDSYVDPVIPKETLSILPVLPCSQGNPVNTLSILPARSAPIDCLKAPVSDSSTIVIDTPSQMSALEVISSQPVLNSSPQTKVSTLPPSSLISSLSSRQICPSYLPSPTLPSYPGTSSPFNMKAPVFKKSSSEKDSDVEKIVELMLLAEILNTDEGFDWDHLDTLLAFLS